MIRPTILRGAAVLAILAAAVVTSVRAGAFETAPMRPSAAVMPQAPADVPLPASCRPTRNPPPTEYGFVARIEGGTVTGPRISARGLDASICGILTVVDAVPGSGCEGIQAQLRIPADGVIVNGVKVELTLVPGERPAVPVKVRASAVRQNLDCVDSSDGFRIKLKLDLRLGVGVFGLQCQIATTGTVSTTVDGPLLNPPYRSEQTMTGSLKAGKVVNNDKFCPGNLPGRVDRLAGLPASGFKTTLPTTMSVYQAG